MCSIELENALVAEKIKDHESFNAFKEIDRDECKLDKTCEEYINTLKCDWPRTDTMLS
jgi:hypothetical protein